MGILYLRCLDMPDLIKVLKMEKKFKISEVRVKVGDIFWDYVLPLRGEIDF